VKFVTFFLFFSGPGDRNIFVIIMISGAQQNYHAPPQSSANFPQQHQRQPMHQNASSHQPPPPPFTGFKLGGTGSAPPTNQARRGGGPKRWTVAQLRAGDAIIPLQSGTNQFASQRGMTGFGSPRNTTTPVYGGTDIHNPQLDKPADQAIPLQYGTNQFASQRGMTGFGQPRDVTGKHLHRLYDDEETPPIVDEYQSGNAQQWQ
jgi:hypothetical protein